MSSPVASPRLAAHVNVTGEHQLIADIGWQATTALRPAPDMAALPPVTIQPMSARRLLRLVANPPRDTQPAPVPTPPTARPAPLASPAPPAAPATFQQPRTARRRTRILLVDEDPAMAEQVRMATDGHAEIRRVDGADAALRTLMLEPVDLVLSKAVLRDGSGLALCRTLRAMARLASLPIVLLFDAPTHGGRADATLAGASDVFVKPVDTGVLARALALALRTRPSDGLADTNALPDLLRQALTRLAEPGFGVREWAECVDLSERQLRRRVIADVGLSPLAWLREQRLQHVQRLLDEGRCRDLREAGGHAGLVNASYLRRLYRARFRAAESARAAHAAEGLRAI